MTTLRADGSFGMTTANDEDEVSIRQRAGGTLALRIAEKDDEDGGASVYTVMSPDEARELASALRAAADSADARQAAS